MKMENETKEEENGDLDKIGVGTKDTVSLKAVPVLVAGHRIDEVKNKANEIVGKKVVLICKHPDREDNIEISQVKYLKGDKVVASGLWFNLDVDQLIPKQSALANMLTKYECNVVADMDGKTIPTDLDGNYLVIKAF